VLAVVGELFVVEFAGDEEVVAVLVGDVAGEEVACPEFEFSFGGVQPRIKASHKQPTKAKVKKCCLEFCAKIFFSCLD
jgi:hypothetical protein